jgi:hypothetical protein
MGRAPSMSALLASVASLALATPAAADTSDAAEFKAAVVYNFARFATWPPSRFPDASASVVLCVPPSEPLAPALARLDGRPVAGRKLSVRATMQLGVGCHIAYVPASATPSQIAALNRQGVLTVGAGSGFSRAGAIGLVNVGRQVRFEINPAAAQEAGVKLSSQLMRLAVLVR